MADEEKENDHEEVGVEREFDRCWDCPQHFEVEFGSCGLNSHLNDGLFNM